MAYAQDVSVPVGTVKTFGNHGISYIVGNPTRELENGDWLISIEVPETGEQLEYELSQIKNDPDEQ